MTTLAQITNEADRIARAIIEAGGELTPELEQELDRVNTDLAQKVDAYSHVIDSLESRAEFFRAQAAQRMAAAKGLEQAIDRMKDRIKHHMVTLGLSEVCGDGVRFKLSKSKPKMEINELLLPEAFKMIVTETTADKEKIRAALSLGEQVPGVSEVPVFSLRQYLNKGDK